MAANVTKVKDALRHINNDNDFLLKNLIWNHPEIITQPIAGGDLLLHYAVKQEKLKAVAVLLGCDELGENDTFVRMFNFFGWWLPPKNNVNDVNLANKEGITPLHYASLQGNVEIARLLLKIGADVNLAEKDSDPLTFLSLPCCKRKIPFHYAIRCTGKTPLHYAIEQWHVEVARLLLQNGADVNLKDSEGYTPLHYAVLGGNIEIATLLLENGADIEARDNKGRTPLHYAVLGGNIEIARLLLQNGADVNLKDSEGYTPLHYAVLWGNIEIATLLLENGADIEAKDNKGRTPLHYAVLGGNIEIARLLLENGADIEAKDNMGHTPLHRSEEIWSSNAKRKFLKKSILAGLWEMSSNEYGSFYQWLPREVAEDITALVEKKDSSTQYRQKGAR